MSSERTDSEKTWDQYQKQIRSFLKKRIDNPSDIDDLQQDILLKTHQNMRKLADHENIKAWIYKVAGTVTSDFYRKKGREEKFHPEDLWYGRDDDQLDHGLEYCLLPFIRQLPSDAADLLESIDLQGQSQKSYASENNLPYSTLKSRVTAARQQLRKLFDDCCQLTLDPHGRVIEYDPKSGKCNNC